MRFFRASRRGVASTASLARNVVVGSVTEGSVAAASTAAAAASSGLPTP
jgi:hypothetical protein